MSTFLLILTVITIVLIVGKKVLAHRQHPLLEALDAESVYEFSTMQFFDNREDAESFHRAMAGQPRESQLHPRSEDGSWRVDVIVRTTPQDPDVARLEQDSAEMSERHNGTSVGLQVGHPDWTFDVSDITGKHNAE